MHPKKSKTRVWAHHFAAVLLTITGILLVVKNVAPAYVPFHNRLLELILITCFVVNNHLFIILHKSGMLPFDLKTMKILFIMEVMIAALSFSITIAGCVLQIKPAAIGVSFILPISYSYLLIAIPGLYIQFHGLLSALIRRWTSSGEKANRP